MISQEVSLPRANKKRLFFALWPDESAVQRIENEVVKHFKVCQGRILQPHNWHITLAYFGSADSDTQACMEQQVQSIVVLPFEIELCVAGFWPRPKVAWLAPEVKPVALETLAHDIQHALVACGYTPESREYQPHLTLVRKASQAPEALEIEPVKMKVNQFCLVESQTSEQGANYHVLKRWNFSR